MKYRSKFEAACAKRLPEFTHETLKLSYTLTHIYLPDFVNEAERIIVETKGRFDAADRRKMLAVKTAHPSWRIVLWFQAPNQRISKKSKTTYRAWALRHGFEVFGE